MAGELKGQLEFGVSADGVGGAINAMKRDLASLGQAAKEAGDASAAGLRQIGEAGGKASANLDASTASLVSRIKRSMAEISNGMKGSLEADLAERLGAARGLNAAALKPWIDALRQIEAGGNSAARAQQTLESTAKQLATAERELAGLRSQDQRQAAQDFLTAQRNSQTQATQRLVEAQRELVKAIDAVAAAHRSGSGKDAAATALASAQQAFAQAQAQVAAIQQATLSGASKIKGADDFQSSIDAQVAALQKQASAAKLSATELLALEVAEKRQEAALVGAGAAAEAQIQKYQALKQAQIDAAQAKSGQAFQVTLDSQVAALERQAVAANKNASELLQMEVAEKRLQASLAGVGAAAEAQIQKFQALKQAQIDAAQAAKGEEFIKGLRQRLDLGTKSTYDLLAQRAAMLGVTNEAKPLLDALAKAEKGFTGVGKESRLAAQQMALVAPQITDIITQLQMGTDPFTILIQQGGQLRDIFGSVGGALKGLAAGFLSLLTNPVVLATAAVAGLTAAYAKGSAQSAEFARTITLTGNAAGLTEGQYNAMARSISEATETTIGSTRGTLQALVASGQLTGQTLQSAASAAQLFSKVTGEGADAVAKRFAGAAEAPAKFAAELNKQYNFLTAAQLQQIKAMEDQGRTQEALAKTFDALNTRLQDAAQHFGTLERWWDTLKRKGSEGIDFVLRIGRVQTTEEMLDTVRQQISNATSQPFNPSRFGGNAEARAQLPDLKRQEAALAIAADEEAQRATSAANRAQAEKDAAAAIDLQNKNLSKTDQLNKAIRDTMGPIAKAIANPLTDPKVRDELLKNYQQTYDQLRDRFKESNSGAQTAFNDATRAQVEAVKQAEKEKLEVIKRSQEDVALRRATGQLSERESIEENTRLDLRALETRRDALLKEAALVAKKKDATGEAAALTRQAAEIEDQITTRSIKGKNELIRLDYEREKAVKAVLAAQYEEYQNDIIKANTADSDARREYFNQQLADLQAIKDENRVLDLQASMLFASAEARQVASEKLKIQIALEKQLQEIRSKFGANSVQETQAIENAELQAQQVQSRVFLSEWEKTTDQVSQALTNALMEGGKSGADYIKGLFRSMVLRPVIQAVMQPVTGAIAGALFGGSNGSDGGGGSSLLGTAGNIASFANMSRSLGSLPWLSNFSGAVEGAGFQAISNGFTGTGEFLINNSNTIGNIGNGLGYASALYSATQGRWGSAIGTGVGTWFFGPIGGMIGGTIGGLLDSAFGGGGTPHRGGAFTVSTDFLAGGRLANAANTPGFGLESGAFRSDRSADVDKSVQSLVTGVASTIGAALTSFGLGAATVTGKFASDNDDDSWAGLRIVGRNGRVLANLDSRNFNSDPQKGFEEFATQAGKTVRDALIAADLPGWADEILKSVGDSAGIDVINQVVAEIKAISDASKALAPALNITTDQFIALTRAVGGASNAASLVQGYIQAIYTDSEQLAVRQKVLAQAFKEINVAVPTSAAAYRKLVESQNLNTEAGRKMYLSLLQLAPVFGEIADAADELKNQAKGVIDEIARLRGATDKDAATTQAQFAIKTAAARAGDKDALSELPGLSKAVEEALTATARSAAEVASIRASLAASLTSTLKALKVPGFATGGDHVGGWRVVGEAGPELEYTPPSRIFNNQQTQSLLDTSALEAEVAALREQVADLIEAARANAIHAAKTAKLIERAMPEGDAIQTRAAD
jgi:phage-related minor tail protein